MPKRKQVSKKEKEIEIENEIETETECECNSSEGEGAAAAVCVGVTHREILRFLSVILSAAKNPYLLEKRVLRRACG